jgi:multicomponent Na+:H+ antiporter subunit D
MTTASLMLLCLGTPVLVALLLPWLGSRPNVREGVTLCGALLLLLWVLILLPRVAAGDHSEVQLLVMVSGLEIAFRPEPLGMLFAVVAAGLWPLNSLYSIGYMRGNSEQHQSRFYVCFAVAIASVMGMAFAANLLTLFVFYEALTLSTYPLVTHKGDEKARQGGRVYLGILLGTSIGFLLPAIIWTWAATGTLDFQLGGIVSGHVAVGLIPLLLAMYMFGIGKAALMPFHRWLPAAMVAPTPVSALLHAVAVVKAGVYAVLKVVIYVFGIDTLATTGASVWLIWVSGATVLIASLVALTKDNLKARLAYSTVSQLSYVVLGAALATSMGVMGGAVQIATHAVGKITLFFCAGAIYTATHKTEVSQLNGLGRVMPFTFGAFFVGALSIIGLPPMGGTWSKWLLLMGAADAGSIAVMGILLLSSLLNIAYLMPVVARGFFMPASDEGRSQGDGIREAPLFCVLPPMITAFGCLLLFFMISPLVAFLAPLIEG